MIRTAQIRILTFPIARGERIREPGIQALPGDRNVD